MRIVLRPLVVGFFSVCLSSGVPMAATQTSGPPQTATPKTGVTITAYSLPPAKLEKAHALYIVEVWLYVISSLYSLGLLVGCLRWGWVVRLREWAERTSRRRIVQAGIVVPVFVVVFSVLMLPPALYGHCLSLRFGLSVQGWGSWFRDWAIQLLLTTVIGTFVAWILFALLHRSPRRSWFYFWLAVGPIAAFLTFIAPALIEHVLNKLDALDSTHPQLVSDLEKVLRRASLKIPRSRMYEMKASEKLTGPNAYVTGFGATKRVVVWDTAIRKMSTEEIQF